MVNQIKIKFSTDQFVAAYHQNTLSVLSNFFKQLQ